MKRILLIGNGTREHVLSETLKRSPQECELAVFGKALNPGLRRLATEYHIGDLDDFDALADFAGRFKPDFAVIGPENPLADGVVDFLKTHQIPSVGPSQLLAQLESSKSFTRELLTKYNIPGNPIFKTFHSPEGLAEYMQNTLGGNYVVKADSLQGGKGVKLSEEHLHSIEEGVAYASECIEADGRVVVEEKFVGEEFSLICFTDGKTLIPCPIAQDHKRAFEGDQGPNTGGMGTYTDVNHRLPFLSEQDLSDAMQISQSVIDALYQETGERFVGFLYGGFIAVKDGVRLIEYNARFGDPEAMNMLSLLESDFIELCEAMIEGRLHEVSAEFSRKASVLKYVVPEGYPDHAIKNELITLKELPQGVTAYLGSVEERDGKLFLLGSRAVALIGYGNTLTEAEALAEAGTQCVEGPVFHRKDIGTDALIQKRIDHMRSIRG